MTQKPEYDAESETHDIPWEPKELPVHGRLLINKKKLVILWILAFQQNMEWN